MKLFKQMHSSFIRKYQAKSYYFENVVTLLFPEKKKKKKELNISLK
jgi:hypothetical protein